MFKKRGKAAKERRAILRDRQLYQLQRVLGREKRLGTTEQRNIKRKKFLVRTAAKGGGEGARKHHIKRLGEQKFIRESRRR